MKRTKMPRNVDTGYATVHQVRVPLWPYLVTPISAVAAYPITWGAHHWYGDSPWTGVALTSADLTVVGFTWVAARPRGPVMRAMATGLATAGSMWTTIAVIESPISQAMFGTWAIGTIVATVVVGAQRILRSGSMGEPVEAEPALGGLLDRVKELKDARFGRAMVVGGKASAEVTMEPGATFSELAGAQSEIASVLDVAAPAVRFIGHPDSERRGRIEAVPVDQLRTPPPWAGPSRPGGSIAEPLLLGVIEDAEPLEIILPGDPKKARNSTHIGVVGMSGAGKTELLLRLAEEVLSREDAELWLGDARKAGQLPGWLLDGAARVATNEDDVDELLADLLGDVSTRSAQMGGHGHKQWTAGCGQCPKYRVVLLDEAAQVAAGNKVFVDLAESLRSVGCALVVGLQRASHDRFPTSARSNIGCWICLGVQDATDADMALSESTLAAGAMPWRWKAAHPGYLYAEIPGVPEDRWVLQARSFAPPSSEDDRAAALAAVTGRPAQRPTTPPPARPAPAAVAPEEPVDEDEPNLALGLGEPPDDVDPAQPVTVPAGTARVRFDDGSDRPQMSPQEAQDELRNYLTDLAEAGTEVIKPAELGEVLYRTGMGGDWLRKHLTRLTLGATPLLRRTEHGHYRILLPEHVG